MRVPVLITALVFSVFLPSVSAVAQDPGMMAAQQAQMAAQQSQMASQQAMQNAQLANQQAMQSAQQANAFRYGPQLLREPKFSLKAGTYSVPQQLRLTSRARGATIYYTTDGWTPTTASPQYDGPITISATTHVQAIAVSPDGRSMVADAVFTLPGAAVPLPVAAVANPAGSCRRGHRWV